MKSVSAGVVLLCERVLLCLGVQRTQGQQPATGSARRAEGGAPRRRTGGAEHGAGGEPAEAGRLLRSEGAGRRTDPPEAATRMRPARTTTPALVDPRAVALRSNFANSDLAFGGSHVFVGNFNGFNTYDIETPKKPQLLASVVCPGGQGDVSVHGNLLFMSVEQTRGRLDCGTQGVTTPVSAERFRGVRIFDISDVKQAEADRRRADVPRIAHAHAGHRSEGQGEPLHLRIRHEHGAIGRGARRLLRADPKEDPNTALFSIDVIQVPLAAPEKAHIVNRPRIFADPATGAHRRPVARRRSRPGHAEDVGDRPVPRHHGVPGNRARGRGLLGQRHPARHLRSGAPGPARSKSPTRTSRSGTRRRSTTTGPR